jgi:HD-like signal output (HDOD) protein
LLGLWGLPDQIVEAVAFHHNPGACSTAFNALTAVHVADFLDHAATEANCLPLDMAYLARLGVADRVPAWEDLYKEMNGSTS